MWNVFWKLFWCNYCIFIFFFLFPFCLFIPRVCCYIPFVLIILLNLSGPDGLNSPECYFFFFFYHSNHISLFPDYICVNKPTTLHVFFTQRLCRKMEDCVLWQAANRSYAWNRLISTSKQSTWVLRLHCLAGLSIAFKNISFLYCRSMVCICSENNFTLCLTSFKKRCLNKITSQATVAGVAFRDSAVDLHGRLSGPSHWA